MTREESIKLLESYQKNKKAEYILIDAIKELEHNLTTAKSVDFEKENNFSSYKPTLPYLIISKLIDLKEKLIKSLYQNSILLDKLERLIYEIGVEGINSGILLSNKFIIGMTTTQLEQKFNFSRKWILQSIQKSIDDFYEKVKNIDYNEFMSEIRNQSTITTEELNNFYNNYFLK